MRILYYMPVYAGTLQDRFERIAQGTYRGELLYGSPELRSLGHDVILPPPIKSEGRKRLVEVMKQLWSMRRQYDLVYTPYFNGLEWVILLHGMGLFRKKIVVWHHSPIERSKSFLGCIRQNLFFRGCDAVLFFTEKLRQESWQPAGNKTHVLNWGPDLSFFDRIRLDYAQCATAPYLMSGSDSRDFDTPIKAFAEMPNAQIDIYPPTDDIRKQYEGKNANIHMKCIERSNDGYYAMSVATAECKAVLIISKPVEGRKLPSGLTSICEAVALGKPCIITDNRYFSDEMRKAGFAIFVKVGDAEGIRNAVQQLENDKDLCLRMSAAALAYARKFDAVNTAKELDSIFRNLKL